MAQNYTAHSDPILRSRWSNDPGENQWRQSHRPKMFIGAAPPDSASPATVSGMATRPSGSDQADIAQSEGAPWVKMVDAVVAPAFESVFVL